MLTSDQVIETNYLESRCALLEIAALLDHYDLTIERSSAPEHPPIMLECLRDAFALLADPQPSTNRTEQLLKLFAKV